MAGIFVNHPSCASFGELIHAYQIWEKWKEVRTINKQRENSEPSTAVSGILKNWNLRLKLNRFHSYLKTNQFAEHNLKVIPYASLPIKPTKTNTQKKLPGVLA